MDPWWQELALTELTTQTPLASRVVVGLLSLALWGAGAALYKAGIRLAAFLGGALAGLLLLDWLAAHALLPAGWEANPWFMQGSALLLGGVTLWLALRAHRLSLMLAGLVVGLSASMGAVELYDGLPAATPFFGAVGGALIMPWLFEAILPLFTAVVGSVGLLWAFGAPDQLVWLVALAFAGVMVQWFGPSGLKANSEDRESAAS